MKDKRDNNKQETSYFCGRENGSGKALGYMAYGITQSGARKLIVKAIKEKDEFVIGSFRRLLEEVHVDEKVKVFRLMRRKKLLKKTHKTQKEFFDNLDAYYDSANKMLLAFASSYILSGGRMTPQILCALAHIQKIKLCLWELEGSQGSESKRLLPKQGRFKGYNPSKESKDQNTQKIKRKDILLVNDDVVRLIAVKKKDIEKDSSNIYSVSVEHLEEIKQPKKKAKPKWVSQGQTANKFAAISTSGRDTNCLLASMLTSYHVYLMLLDGGARQKEKTRLKGKSKIEDKNIVDFLTENSLADIQEKGAAELRQSILGKLLKEDPEYSKNMKEAFCADMDNSVKGKADVNNVFVEMLERGETKKLSELRDKVNKAKVCHQKFLIEAKEDLWDWYTVLTGELSEMSPAQDLASKFEAFVKGKDALGDLNNSLEEPVLRKFEELLRTLNAAGTGVSPEKALKAVKLKLTDWYFTNYLEYLPKKFDAFISGSGRGQQGLSKYGRAEKNKFDKLKSQIDAKNKDFEKEVSKWWDESGSEAYIGYLSGPVFLNDTEAAILAKDFFHCELEIESAELPVREYNKDAGSRKPVIRVIHNINHYSARVPKASQFDKYNEAVRKGELGKIKDELNRIEVASYKGKNHSKSANKDKASEPAIVGNGKESKAAANVKNLKEKLKSLRKIYQEKIKAVTKKENPHITAEEVEKIKAELVEIPLSMSEINVAAFQKKQAELKEQVFTGEKLEVLKAYVNSEKPAWYVSNSFKILDNHKGIYEVEAKSKTCDTFKLKRSAVEAAEENANEKAGLKTGKISIVVTEHMMPKVRSNNELAPDEIAKAKLEAIVDLFAIEGKRRNPKSGLRLKLTRAKVSSHFKMGGEKDGAVNTAMLKDAFLKKGFIWVAFDDGELILDLTSEANRKDKPENLADEANIINSKVEIFKERKRVDKTDVAPGGVLDKVVDTAVFVKDSAVGVANYAANLFGLGGGEGKRELQEVPSALLFKSMKEIEEKKSRLSDENDSGSSIGSGPASNAK